MKLQQEQQQADNIAEQNKELNKTKKAELEVVDDTKQK